MPVEATTTRAAPNNMHQANSGNPFISGISPPQNGGNFAAAMNLAQALSTQALEGAKESGTNTQQTGASGDYGEVENFLNSIALTKYKERFVENGIEDEETILELSDEHLDALKVPLGHKLKILKRIKTIRQEKGMTVPESRQG